MDNRRIPRARVVKQTTKPREVGILFRGDMIRALLAGAKTETRRPIKPEPDVLRKGLPTWYPSYESPRVRAYDGEEHFARGMPRDFARWRPGDRLWVRETWRPWIRARSSHVQWRADGARSDVLGPRASRAAIEIAEKHGGHWDDGRGQDPSSVKWRPSLLMPRWACRITLPVLSVRAERLTAITDAGAVAEGFVHAGLGATAADYCREYRKMHKLAEDADPWVWVVEFVREVQGG